MQSQFDPYNQLEMYAILDRSRMGELNRLLIRIRKYEDYISGKFLEVLEEELLNNHENYLNSFPKAKKII